MLAPHSNDHEPVLTANAVLAAKGRSFYWASHFLGTLHAHRATRLYRLCRHIDDIADEGPSLPDAIVDLNAIVQAIRSGVSDDIIIEDGMQLFKECDIDPAVFIELIAGVQSDLLPVNMPDMDALLHYCYQVAGTVGLMMCKALDTHHKAAFAHAVDLGIAMQLTNICRDITADAAMGRRYLPASLVGNLTPDDLLNPSEAVRKTVQSAISRLLALADTYYLSGEQGLFHLPLGARAGILLSARIYQGIGKELQRRQLCFWGKRVVVSTARKCLISAGALGTFIFRQVLWVRPLPHNSQLHQALHRTQPASASAFLDHAT
jgi:phytoene synthase